MASCAHPRKMTSFMWMIAPPLPHVSSSPWYLVFWQCRKLALRERNAPNICWKPLELGLKHRQFESIVVHETCLRARDLHMKSHNSPPPSPTLSLTCPTNRNRTDQQAPGFHFSPQRLRCADTSIPLRAPTWMWGWQSCG